MRIHTKTFFTHLPLDIDIPSLTANGQGYRKPIDLSEQLLSLHLKDGIPNKLPHISTNCKYHSVKFDIDNVTTIPTRFLFTQTVL